METIAVKPEYTVGLAFLFERVEWVLNMKKGVFLLDLNVPSQRLYNPQAKLKRFMLKNKRGMVLSALYADTSKIVLCTKTQKN